ncbi:hypothetical protein HZZ02_24545, partial [Streptococcus danieliae]|nr:hypothetical protein [Streptococcus danieliae]
YQANEELEAGERVLLTQGQEGVRQPDGSVSKEPVAEVYQIGTKPKVEDRKIPFSTVFETRDTEEVGFMSVVVTGVVGIERTT